VRKLSSSLVCLQQPPTARKCSKKVIPFEAALRWKLFVPSSTPTQSTKTMNWMRLTSELHHYVFHYSILSSMMVSPATKAPAAYLHNGENEFCILISTRQYSCSTSSMHHINWTGSIYGFIWMRSYFRSALRPREASGAFNCGELFSYLCQPQPHKSVVESTLHSRAHINLFAKGA